MAKKTVQVVLGLVVAMALSGVTLLAAFDGADSASAQETGPGGEVAANANVPASVRALVSKYAGTCPRVTASLLAAQLYTESHFDAKAKSPVGAPGIAQFMPGTWSVQGVDGDGETSSTRRTPSRRRPPTTVSSRRKSGPCRGTRRTTCSRRTTRVNGGRLPAPVPSSQAAIPWSSNFKRAGQRA